MHLRSVNLLHEALELCTTASGHPHSCYREQDAALFFARTGSYRRSGADRELAESMPEIL